MPAYTIPLWKAIEMSGGTTSIREDGVKIMTGGDIGLNYFTTFNPEHKVQLVGKIMDHYWNREIGQETLPMFQLAMRRKMNEIMPYYNKLYETETFEFDPMSTIKLHTINSGTEVQNVEVESDGTQNTDNHSATRTVQSAFPQTMLNGSGDYATSGADANTDTDGNTTAHDSKSSDSTTDTDTETNVEGYQAYPSNLLTQYRQTILNIDMLIIAELDDCFMQIWNTADDYDKNPPLFSAYPFI
jgi:hypothetical protein